MHRVGRDEIESHPVWVRGLKLLLLTRLVTTFWSHPVWVRGLKLEALKSITAYPVSHPVWVRGLKLSSVIGGRFGHKSHPVWVRGLKLIFQVLLNFLGCVAPRVGAWIETIICHWWSFWS